jgi:hypothetical protein
MTDGGSNNVTANPALSGGPDPRSVDKNITTTEPKTYSSKTIGIAVGVSLSVVVVIGGTILWMYLCKRK